MQIKKRNLVVISLILLLCIVGYAYNSFTDSKFTGTDFGLQLNDDNQEQGTNDKANPDQQQILGNKDKDNTQAASGDKSVAVVGEQDPPTTVETSSSSFFSEYRLERDKNRSKEVEMWEGIINNQSTEPTFKNQAQQELVKIVALTEKEMIIENLIISRGFNDAIVFLTDEAATVIVDARELNQQNVAQIQDIVCRKTKLDASKVKIMKKNLNISH